MRISNAFIGSVLFIAGCSTYPEHQASYSSYSTSPTYTTPPTYSDQVISTPAYNPSTEKTGAAQLMADSDRNLANTVRQALERDPRVSTYAPAVYVSARNGTVTLTGTAPSESDRQFIDNVVRNINGVYAVNDQMQVTAQATGAESRIYIAPVTAPTTYSTAASTVVSPGNIFNLHVQGLNEPDRTLAQHILQELRADTILPSLLPSVNITVANGRVILDGNVQNDEQRRVIESAVQRAAGGNNVTDELRLTSPYPR